VAKSVAVLFTAIACLRLAAVASAQTSCIETAQKAADQAKAAGLSQARIDRAYAAALLECQGVKDAGLASFAAAANLDYARLARMFLAGNLTTADYLQRVRDRSAKLRLARTDPAFRTAFTKGDADGDLVPDDRDKCANTPELTITGRDGCPVRQPLPRVPSEQAMREARRALRGISLVANPKCAEAPMPEAPILLHQGFLRPDGNLANHFYGMAVSRSRNQPAGCEVYYQFMFRFSSRVDATFPPTKIIQVTFNENESTDTTPKAEVRRIFKVKVADTGHRQDLFRSSVKYGLVEWRVRAIGGNGLTSGWSELRHEKFNGVFKPDGP
jgi:hypothetical protein